MSRRAQEKLARPLLNSTWLWRDIIQDIFCLISHFKSRAPITSYSWWEVWGCAWCDYPLWWDRECHLYKFSPSSQLSHCTQNCHQFPLSPDCSDCLCCWCCLTCSRILRSFCSSQTAASPHLGVSAIFWAMIFSNKVHNNHCHKESLTWMGLNNKYLANFIRLVFLKFVSNMIKALLRQ